MGEPGSNDSFLVTGLKPSTQYTFTLRSVDTSGVSSSGSATSQPSTTDTTTPDPSPPRIENFEATAVLLNCTQIALEWDHPEELNRKEVRLTWSPAHGESQPKAFNDFTTTRGSATITDLRDNTPYTFTIVSRNTDDEDSTGVPQTITTSTCPALEAPTEINSTSGRNSITLRWKNPVQKDFKHVTIDLITAVGSSTTDNDGNTIASTDHEGEPGATDSHTISNLSVNTQYTFRLTAVDRSDNTTAATPDYEARTLPDADGDGVSDVEDVDDDNDGLIEIHSLDMLANINNNLDGTSYDSDGLDTGSTTFDACGPTTPNGRGSICGAATADTAATIRNCGAGTRLCGYELARSLDFAEDSSYDTGSRNKAFWCPRVSISGCDGFFRRGVTNGFTGLGTNTANFNAIFEGNGLTISRLYMRYYVSDAETLFIGFFKRTSANASIRNLGLLKVYVNNVNISSHLGALVGHNSGAVIASYTAGFIQGSYATDHIGGLVGTNAGTIVASYSMAAINGSDGNDNAGGLVGRNVGNVSASYATGQISYFMTGNTNTGGLVGSKSSAARIVASYATGFVSGGGWSIARVGSLVGFVPDGGEATIVSSYGFGGARGGRRNNVGAVPSTCGVYGMTKCTPSTLTLAAAGTTQWNSAANDTLGAWDFGTSSDPHPPRLKYADYDDGGTSYGCSNTQFQPYGPDIICGSTELPNQELDSDGDGVLDSVDVDDDNDGLIEIHNLDMLFHVHYNLQGQAYDSTGSGTTDTDTATNVAGCGTTSDKGSFCGAPKTLMGTACPAGSTDVDPHATNEAYLCGYELTRDLDFADAASYASGSRNNTWCPVASTCNGGSTQAGFDGIGNETTTASTGGFAAIFEGNGLSIGRLYMRNTSSTGKNMGLFRRTESTAVIRNLGLTDANVYGGSGNDQSGILVGHNDGGDITSSYASIGAVNGGGGDDILGGLVGKNEGSTSAIVASYSAVHINGGAGADKAGGLVGDISSSSSIAACYAMGSVTGGADNDSLGGLVGTSTGPVTITASYATTSVDGGSGTSDSVGSLVGTTTNTTIEESYGFGTRVRGEVYGENGSLIPHSCGSDGRQECEATTLTLSAAGSQWNAALSDTYNAWNFGTSTSLPRLKYAAYDLNYSCNNDQFSPYGPGIVCGSTELPKQTLPLSAITNFTAAEANCATVNLNWDHPPEPTRKEVSITWTPRDGLSQPQVFNDFTTNTRGMTTITGLKDSTEYTFTITSKDQNNQSSSTATAPAITTSACGALGAPSNITSTATNTTITLGWTNPSQHDFSHVTISYPSGPTIPDQIGTAGGSGSFIVTDLMGETSYTFTLRAEDTSGITASATHTVSTTGTTTPDPKPPRIKNFQATAVALECTQVSLEWDRPEELNRKEVRLTWSPTGGDQSQPLVLDDFSTARGSTTITGLQDNRSYTFSIVSRNTATSNSDSDAVEQTAMTTTCAALEPPSSISSEVTHESITLYWTNPVQKDLKHVTITISPATDKDGDPITIPSQTGRPGDAASYTVSNLNFATEYSLTLTAVDTRDNRAAATVHTVSTVGDDDGDGVVDVFDVDDDNDGLIEIHNLDMLIHINNNLAGTSYDTDTLDTASTTFDTTCGTPTANGRGSICGAPNAPTTNCTTNVGTTENPAYLCGYELARNLDFADDDSYLNASTNKATWCPAISPLDCNDTRTGTTAAGFPGIAESFNAIFDGNGLSISNLYMRGNAESIGFFRKTESNAIIRNLGLVGANVSTVTVSITSASGIGALVGDNRGVIVASYTTGTVQKLALGNFNVGGLVGGNNQVGSIIASYSMSTVKGEGSTYEGIGGLVGYNGGSTITASYATGDVRDNVGVISGGLVGWNVGSSITASYATGAVNRVAAGFFTVASGPLVGRNDLNGVSIDSYGFGEVSAPSPSQLYINSLGAPPNTCGVSGDVKCTPSTLTLADADPDADPDATPAVPNNWNVAAATVNRPGLSSVTINTLNAWKFGTSSDPHPPRIRYADYDGAGSTYSCSDDQFLPYGPRIECGTTELPGQELDSDGDGVLDSIDVDDDNDGLIEIHNLDMLFHIHYNLEGQAYDSTGSGTTDTDTASAVGDCGTTSDRGTFCGAPKTLTGTACPAASADVDPGTGTAYLCGYELTRDLDFSKDISYASGSRNTTWCPVASTCNDTSTTSTNAGFPGIGRESTTGSFNAIFEGNGFSVRRLYMRDTSNGGKDIGLFRNMSTNAIIRNLGVTMANLYNSESPRGGGSGSNDFMGILVGHNLGGDIVGSYVKGNLHIRTGSRDSVGGLVGRNKAGVIIASYAAVDITGNSDSDYIGGLVGVLDGAATIIASYTTGTLNGAGGNGDSVGGLVGIAKGRIIASYTNASVDGGTGAADYAGGLVGSGNVRITASYAFGSTLNDDSGGNDGTAIPSTCGTGSDTCTVNTLTLTAAGTQWSLATSNTLNAWDFGTNSTPPKLKYASYGTNYTCNNDQFQPYAPAITCGTATTGTLLPGQ